MVSVEVAEDRHSVMEVEGLWAHANHTLHPAMRDLDQFEGPSSASRQQIADEWTREVAKEDLRTIQDLQNILSSHEDERLPICRHGQNGRGGCTLSTALIEADALRIHFTEGIPCERE